MGIGFGYKAWMGVGTETTYGTPLAPLQHIEINSESLAAEDDVVYGNSTYNVAQDVDNIAQGRKKVGGSFSFDMRRQGNEVLLKYAMGTLGTATLGAGGTAIERTYTIPDTLGTSLCLYVDRDAATFCYEGVKINTFTINGNNEGIVTCDMDVIAENEGTATGTSSPTLSTTGYWMFQNAGMTYGGTTQNVRDFKITVNQNLTDDRYHWGSRFLKEPQRAGRIEVTGEFTIEFTGSTEWYNFNSMGTGALVATYTGATLDGTVAEKLTITCPKVRYTGGVPAVADSGLITQTIPFVAYADGTIKPINIVEVSSLGTNTDNY